VPAEWIPALGIIATVAEILLGLLLLVGWHTRATALLSALLLLTFGVAMTFGLGVKAPLNYSVFAAMGGALLLANCQSFPFSLDQLRLRRIHSTRDSIVGGGTSYPGGTHQDATVLVANNSPSSSAI
jgi:uncharacterized membrane protein YphA (DoxX/SURF4 family)